jgi:uncharacterized protein (DUF885 family)
MVNELDGVAPLRLRETSGLLVSHPLVVGGVSMWFAGSARRAVPKVEERTQEVVLMTDSAAVLLADDYWAYYCATEQLWNVDRGEVDQIEHWEDLSPTGLADRVAHLEHFVERAAAVDRDRLDERSGSLVGAVAFSARATASTLPYTRDLSLVAGPFSLMTFLKFMVPGYTLITAEHGRGYVSKLRSTPTFVDGWIAGLADGLAAGRCATARGLAAAIAELDDMLQSDAVDDPLVAQEPPSDMSDGEVERWRAELVACVSSSVRPALGRLRNMLRDSMLPGARGDDRPGICHLADGGVDYEALLHAATSTHLTAAEIHEIGRVRLAVLDEEYRTLGRAALGIDHPAELRAHLRDDPSLRYTSASAVIDDAIAALERAQAVAPRWFERLPSAICSPIANDGGPMAYYTAPSPDGARGGRFCFNTSEPSMWTRFSLEATTFHESVPGHHVQLALAQELDLHPVLGELEVTSYSEGWGLYAERLADEMSLYGGPLQQLGMLTLDSLRAARLVVDTGLHAFGWTRLQAVEFLLASTSLLADNAEREIDRYIASPAQSTSYMIGRLEIERLRTRAAARLGDRFSLPEFHTAVLGNGMSPLTELGRSIDTWIDRVERRQGPTAPDGSR